MQLVYAHGLDQEIRPLLSQVSSTNSTSLLNKSLLKCKESQFKACLYGQSIEWKMDHLDATRPLVKILNKKIQPKLMLNFRIWPSQLSEIKLLIWPSTIFWKTDKSLEMESKMKCKNFWPDGVCGLKLVKSKMLKLPLSLFSQTCKQNSERRVDKKLKRFLLKPKTKWDKKL